jgi:hypothetical protein
VGGGLLTAGASAWRLDVTWGAASTPRGEQVAWGVTCEAGDPACATVAWARCASGEPACAGIDRVAAARNVVWGTACGGADCQGAAWRHSRRSPETRAARGF